MCMCMYLLYVCVCACVRERETQLHTIDASVQADTARLLLQILTSRGIEIGKLSAVPSEAEILLPAGTVLKITGVLPKDASGLTIVTLQDDEDAPELIY